MGEAHWPRAWVGTWVADAGKTVVIEHEDGPRVTVAPSREAPAYVAELLGGETMPVEQLRAACVVDDGGVRLELEAGTIGLGPTYRLYAVVDGAGGRRPAPDDAAVADVVLLPVTMIGLYDDLDDDVGVPWAYPLEPLRWVAPPPVRGGTHRA